MSRPLRIEYENAYYHVMNRGRAGHDIFHSEQYFKVFLGVLEEAHQRFGLQVLCYCLMSNHYHLLVKTPEANLGRVMRHINGVYTQRHNRMKHTDGPLFRGRYKAICVEEDSYQLQLSRYIHRNPVEAKVVDDLVDYPWSSYRYYVSDENPPKWLYQGDIFDQLHARSKVREKYMAFVELGVDEEIARFYGKGNIMPYLGSDAFRDWAYAQRETEDTALSKQDIQLFRPSIDEIVQLVAKTFGVSVNSIIRGQKGIGKNNVPRWVAMHLSQEIGSKKLIVIANAFGLKRTGSIPTTVKKLRALLDRDLDLLRKMEKIRRVYDT
ncbi:MAG: transposase [Mariprofundaceae bacterium]